MRLYSPLGDGATWEGDVADDRPDGHGRLTYPDGTTYEGEARRGRAHGQGILAAPDGRRYLGEWRGGRPHGVGIVTDPDGRVGVLRDGRRCAAPGPLRRLGDTVLDILDDLREGRVAAAPLVVAGGLLAALLLSLVP